MNVLDLLKGKEMMVTTDVKVDVKLTIKEVKPQHHSVETGPSTRENDWWPTTHDWTTYLVTFTNGASREYSSLNDIKIIE